MEVEDIEQLKKILTTVFVQLGIAIVYGTVVAGFFYLTIVLDSTYKFTKESSLLYTLSLETTIPAFLNFILILICDDIYDTVAERLTDYENH